MGVSGEGLLWAVSYLRRCLVIPFTSASMGYFGPYIEGFEGISSRLEGPGPAED